MNTPRSPQHGFTLVEVLVILAILAVLAGVLIPNVANQVSKSDSARVAADLQNIRTGVEAFVVDVKRFPGDIEDLIIKPGAGDKDINDVTYPSALRDKWTGPYVDITVVDSTSTIPTAYGATILPGFAKQAFSSQNYVTVLLTGLAQADFLKIDAQIDGDTSSTAGRLRFVDATVDTVKYLALPVN